MGRAIEKNPFCEETYLGICEWLGEDKGIVDLAKTFGLDIKEKVAELFSVYDIGIKEWGWEDECKAKLIFGKKIFCSTRKEVDKIVKEKEQIEQLYSLLQWPSKSNIKEIYKEIKKIYQECGIGLEVVKYLEKFISVRDIVVLEDFSIVQGEYIRCRTFEDAQDKTKMVEQMKGICAKVKKAEKEQLVSYYLESKKLYEQCEMGYDLVERLFEVIDWKSAFSQMPDIMEKDLVAIDYTDNIEVHELVVDKDDQHQLVEDEEKLSYNDEEKANLVKSKKMIELIYSTIDFDNFDDVNLKKGKIEKQYEKSKLGKRVVDFLELYMRTVEGTVYESVEKAYLVRKEKEEKKREEERQREEKRQREEEQARVYQLSKENYKRGDEAYEMQDYIEAANWYEKSAMQYYPPAYFKIGQCYMDGKGRQKDYELARRYLILAEDGGYIDACMLLAELDFDKDNYVKSQVWYEKYIENVEKLPNIVDKITYISALNHLGKWWCEGKGNIPQDSEKGIKYYEKAALLGDAESQYQLGLAYYYGKGKEKDEKYAFKYLKQAASGGNKNAKLFLQTFEKSVKTRTQQKYCSNCGNTLNEREKFCSQCGAEQKTDIKKENQNTNIVSKKNIPTNVRQKKKQSGLGIASFVFGLIAIFTGGVFIIPEILGIIFYYRGKRNTTKKQGLGKAGMILSVVSIIMFVLIMFL